MYQLLANRSFLRLLLVVNLLGAIYGYIWYLPQLQLTKVQFWLFVPDSPTAILFFAFVLIAFLGKKHWPLMEALAFVCLVKYGIWAVGMNIFLMLDQKMLLLTSVMLLLSHGLMALEGILYAPFYRFRISHFMIAAVWILHNDVIDYLFGQMPIYMGLERYLPYVGYATFWLSVLVLFFVYQKAVRKDRFKLELY
ncbi:DUF1405 domain-containing protein [Listeria aquatica]|uniref:DUF1405 domain-containing protein n=1 Tax=Listeria aquatica FSL S10-1188 TaxID=1265818 RepID=W7B2H9_9LIST|nr:DUF1405 domain-containing protein [Listeria aquatica]EUJ19620.1 hypothetical protein MAQA_05468 [Listeria aquatica FSL S10-1188]